jgi:hypothetical protein
MENEEILPNEEIFQIEELEARLEMQPLPTMMHSSCTSNCDGDQPPPDDSGTGF